jgi:hypothetical protein
VVGAVGDPVIVGALNIMAAAVAVGMAVVGVTIINMALEVVVVGMAVVALMLQQLLDPVHPAAPFKMLHASVIVLARMPLPKSV